MNWKKLIKILILPLLLLCAFLWYRAPVRFLRDIKASEVACIRIFDGNTGHELDLTDPAVIETVLTNLQTTPVRRSGISLLHMGYRYRMTFQDAAGGTLGQIILNSATTLRHDPFFYKNEDGGLCYDYIWDIFDKSYGYLS